MQEVEQRMKPLPRVSIGLRARIGWKWMQSREIFKQGRQNSAGPGDQNEKRRVQQLNITVDFWGKGFYSSYTPSAAFMS